MTILKTAARETIWLLGNRFFCKTNNIWHSANRALEEPVSINGGNPGGVLGISSDGDDRMEPKVKTQKNY